jgi:hypothetical protein
VSVVAEHIHAQAVDADTEFSCFLWCQQLRQVLDDQVLLSPEPFRIHRVGSRFVIEVFTVDANLKYGRQIRNAAVESAALLGKDHLQGWQLSLDRQCPLQPRGCWSLDRPTPFVWRLHLTQG